MNDETKSNDCAFPMLETSEPGWQFGLTKREKFAGMALQGLLANPDVRQELLRQDIAMEAVEHADRLIDALNSGITFPLGRPQMPSADDFINVIKQCGPDAANAKGE